MAAASPEHSRATTDDLHAPRECSFWSTGGSPKNPETASSRTTVIILRVVEGLSMAEVADCLDITVPTAKACAQPRVSKWAPKVKDEDESVRRVKRWYVESSLGVCGHTALVESAEQLVLDLSHERSRIKTERFGAKGG